jgi:hypothetical protein
VSGGGSLVATFESSLYDEWGVKRKDFGLTDLFGVSFKGPGEGPMRNAYLRLEHDTAGGHPLLKGLEDAPRIVHGVWRLEVEAREKFPNPPLTLIPSYPDLPMEKVYPRAPRSNQPEVFLREFDSTKASGLPVRGLTSAGHGTGGKETNRTDTQAVRPASRLVYFPWDIDRTFWEVLCVDHLKLLRNAVQWATNEEPQVTVTGPGILDVTLWRQKRSMTLHLVNLTNPMMMKGPVRELIPIGEQKVRVRLPEGTKPHRVRLLAAGKIPRYNYDGGYLNLAVSSILDHEIVAVDLQLPG